MQEALANEETISFRLCNVENVNEESLKEREEDPRFIETGKQGSHQRVLWEW